MNGTIPPPSTALRSSIIVTQEGQELTITIRRQAWLAVRVIIHAAIAAGTQPAGVLLGVLIGLVLAWAGYHLPPAEELFAPLIVVFIVGAVTLPIVLWFGFTKTVIRVDEHDIVIQHRGLLMRRQVRWPKQLVGDVRRTGHAVRVLSVDGRQLAKVIAFWPWEEMVIVTMLRQALGLSEL